jgi:hypothetical protein
LLFAIAQRVVENVPNVLRKRPPLLRSLFGQSVAQTGVNSDRD